LTESPPDEKKVTAHSGEEYFDSAQRNSRQPSRKYPPQHGEGADCGENMSELLEKNTKETIFLKRLVL
jgi:hypothetical protein